MNVANTVKEGVVVGIRSMTGDPYDGHPLVEALEQVEIRGMHTASNGHQAGPRGSVKIE